MRRLAAALVVLAFVALPGAAVAASCARTTIADLEDEVMCPLCGTSLGLARESPQAQRERAYIGRLIASCRSKDEIKAALVRQFGPAVLAEPPERGFSASAYVVPIAGGAAILGAVLLAFLRWRRNRTERPARARRIPARDDRRLEAELDHLR